MTNENNKKINLPIARVINYTYPTNKFRVAKAETTKSILERPVKNLIPLIRPDELA